MYFTRSTSSDTNNLVFTQKCISRYAAVSSVTFFGVVLITFVLRRHRKRFYVSFHVVAQHAVSGGVVAACREVTSVRRVQVIGNSLQEVRQSNSGILPFSVFVSPVIYTYSDTSISPPVIDANTQV